MIRRKLALWQADGQVAWIVAVMHTSAEITQLLSAVQMGDPEAFNRLVPLVYDELRNLARHHLNRQFEHNDDQMLQTTALVHEAYMRLARQDEPSWNSRVHFFAVAAKTMRSVLVDHARRRTALKRGGDSTRINLDQALEVFEHKNLDILALDDALSRLAEIDERKCRTVELRFFGGMSNEESAAALGVSAPTVERDWRMARAWLRRELNGVSDSGCESGPA
jgi:RNA polymerase sigma-70 factor (ECF subfamily)